VLVVMALLLAQTTDNKELLELILYLAPLHLLAVVLVVVKREQEMAALAVQVVAE